MGRVVITGLGLASSLGSDLKTAWSRLIAGETGIRTISFFDASKYKCHVAAQASETPQIAFDPGVERISPAFLRRGAQLLGRSALEAWSDAGLTRDGRRYERRGAAVGASVNYLNMGWVAHQFWLRNTKNNAIDMPRFASDGAVPAALHYRRQGDFFATFLAGMLGLAGPTVVHDSACAAGLFALADAVRRLQRGEVDVMVAGGATAVVTPIGILSFALLGALSPNSNPEEASRPFDRNRDGFVMGEAGGVVILERLEHALARNARIYCEIAGVGMTLSAINLTDPSPNGEAEAAAMRLALAEASIGSEDVDFVAAHGTSTLKNDLTETLAIKRAFGQHAYRLAVSSNKGQLGHTIAAAGVCNVICAAKAIAEGIIPPTAHLQTPDPACDLDYVPGVGRKAVVHAAVANAFAFGGQNASVALRRLP